MTVAPAGPLPATNLLLAQLGKMPVGGDSLATLRVNEAIRELRGKSRTVSQQNWVRAVARLVLEMRPDIGPQLVGHLDVEPLEIGNPLGGLSIGEMGVVYEALIALSDGQNRRSQGQYFTPDDVATYMASQVARFQSGVWLDPCCGVGNLSWHLANKNSDPAEFVANCIVLIDSDPVALTSALVLLIASFANRDDFEALPKLVARSYCRNFLDAEPLPEHDYVIVNPPYAAAERIARFRTADTRELFAYFLERISTESNGFIAITPATYLGSTKYAELRAVLGLRVGGDVLVFDNVPDTCFRGYKFGSTNTSKTNFVRAAITVSSPHDKEWQVTPILRWSARSRRTMWRSARKFLVPMRKGPAGEWAKVMPGTEHVWDFLSTSEQCLRDIVSRRATAYSLEVASTPRYYVSASKRSLDRRSKHILFFDSKADLDRAYILLNSSLPYWWWRCLDGGITLPLRTLLSLPVPFTLSVNKATVDLLEDSECEHVVTKLNSGRQNENVRRPRSIIDCIDSELLGGIEYCFSSVYSPDMFESHLFGIALGGSDDATAI